MAAYTEVRQQATPTVDDGDGRTRRLFDHGETRLPSWASLSQPRSLIVPTSSFNRMAVEVVDPEGEPIPEIDWLMSANIFPTAARIDDSGVGIMWLLSVTYSNFMAVADIGQGRYNLVWFSSVEEQTNILPTQQDFGTIVVEPVYPGNLNVRSGVSMGL